MKVQLISWIISYHWSWQLTIVDNIFTIDNGSRTAGCHYVTMTLCPAMPGTDFSRVNNLRPVSERADKPGPAASQPDKSAAAGARVRELSPSLSSNSTMYQSLRSYVGKCLIFDCCSWSNSYIVKLWFVHKQCTFVPSFPGPLRQCYNLKRSSSLLIYRFKEILRWLWKIVLRENTENICISNCGLTVSVLAWPAGCPAGWPTTGKGAAPPPAPSPPHPLPPSLLSTRPLQFTFIVFTPSPVHHLEYHVLNEMKINCQLNINLYQFGANQALGDGDEGACPECRCGVHLSSVLCCPRDDN